MGAVGRVRPMFILWGGLLLAVGLFLVIAVRSARTPVAAMPRASQPSIRAARLVPIFGFLHLAGGSPVVDQTVIAVYVHGSHRRIAAAAPTNRYGAFAFDKGLATGVYTIYVLSPDVSVASRPLRLLAVKESPYIVLDLKVEAGTLKASCSSGTGVRHTVIFGLVTRPDGLTPLSPKGFLAVVNSQTTHWSLNAGERAFVGECGAFVLPRALAPGTYTVTALNGRGYAVARAKYVVPQTRPAYMVLIVRGGSGLTAHHVAALAWSPPAPRSPTPWAKGSMFGRVVDSRGHPVVDGTIFLSNDTKGLLYQAITDKDGRYAIRHILLGQYIADAFGPRSPEFMKLAAGLGAAVAGHAPVDLKKMAAAEAAASKNWEGVTDVVVAITNAGLEKNFTLRKLRPGEYKAPVGSGSMGGRVLDSAGHPVVGAYVCLTNTAMNLGYHAITDKDGRYLIRRVLPARYVAEVIPPVPPGLMRVRVLTPAMPAELGMLKGISEVVRIRRGQLKEDFTLQKLVPAATIPAARATGAARERGIVEACMVYAQGNGGRYPPDLAILVAHGYITPKALIDPNAGTTPADLSHLPFRQAHDVSVVARRIKGHCDFVYVGRGLTTKACAGAAGAAIIVVYEKAPPSYRPVGRNVAFADGDAKWEAVSAIPGVFAANNAARRAAKLPVVRVAP